MSTYQPSRACCATPAIIGPPYPFEGSFIEIAGTKCYTAGPSTAQAAIFIIYDIFGYSGQILENADKLGEHHQVFMPDFFDVKPTPLDWMPLDGPADEEKMDDFCEEPGETQTTVKRDVRAERAGSAIAFGG
ncbi:hypothetical protein BAUCODRAFT_145757 [Baudoinia panamericana UAMH 10762]|uniref:Dienelactone hydrolase domain-containing protein n=1 Tax=Baudoinia panamericana (strain UAMH 10762) TaxID=717646 RepID=M2NI13_BAUPA|nr:uncharacterized protein BAUCODRAFT_145757 [Baudoinia panamericana UAMH 10762]EMC98725.1 hypothetical protein BAUCODRAFT_145757 [Baudoinia panamericana UAMH 10762]